MNGSQGMHTVDRSTVSWWINYTGGEFDFWYQTPEVAATGLYKYIYDSDQAVIAKIPDTSSFITKAVNNLENYYLKSETYTQDEVNALIAAIGRLEIKVVDTVEDVTENGYIYLVPKTGSEKDIYDEYIYITDVGPEKIGSTDIDLSQYYTKDEADSLLETKQDTLTAGDNIEIEYLDSIVFGNEYRFLNKYNFEDLHREMPEVHITDDSFGYNVDLYEVFGYNSDQSAIVGDITYSDKGGMLGARINNGPLADGNFIIEEYYADTASNVNKMYYFISAKMAEWLNENGASGLAEG